MKKISILFFALLLVAGAYGQELSAPSGQESKTPTEKGSLWLGGTFNILSLFGNFYANSTNVIINPFGSYFIKDNIMVGGMIQLVLGFQENFSQSAFNIGPWVGYAFKKFKPGEETVGAVIPFAKVGFLLAGNSTKFEDWKTTTSGISIPIGGGIIYTISRTLGFVGDISFSLDSLKIKDNVRAAAALNENGASGGNRFVISLGLAFTRFGK